MLTEEQRKEIARKLAEKKGLCLEALLDCSDNVILELAKQARIEITTY